MLIWKLKRQVRNILFIAQFFLAVFHVSFADEKRVYFYGEQRTFQMIRLIFCSLGQKRRSICSNETCITLSL